MDQQVQVLPYVPTPLEQLTPHLAQFGANIGEGLARRQAKKEYEKFYESKSTQNQNGSTKFNSSAAINPLDISKEYEVNAEYKGKDYANALMKSRIEEQKLQQKQANAIELKNLDRQSAIVQKIQTDAVGKRESINRQRLDYKVARQAAKEGNVGGFDINWVANQLGPWAEPLKNKSGIQLETAMKNVLLDTLSQVKGRPNQWIEQRIQSATPSIGKNPAANDAIFDFSEAKLDLDEKILDAKDDIIQLYESKGLPIPSNIDKLANESIKDYAIQREADLAYDLRSDYEKYEGIKSLKPVPNGTPLTFEKRDYLIQKSGGDKKKALELARKLGYTIPNEQTALRAQQRGQ